MPVRDFIYRQTGPQLAADLNSVVPVSVSVLDYAGAGSVRLRFDDAGLDDVDEEMGRLGYARVVDDPDAPAACYFPGIEDIMLTETGGLMVNEDQSAFITRGPT